ncbi:MAG: TonB family protein [Gemmatimonadetes bacterium]|nr:TonB family protein [Gemmatimonadota bacterium]
MRFVIFCLATLLALPAPAQGTLTGHVRDPAGFGIASAEVRIAVGPPGAATTAQPGTPPGSPDTPPATITDAHGAFRILGVPAGTVTVSARRIGFRPGSHGVTVTDGQTVDVTVALAFTALQLEPVMVSARREPFDARLAGFQLRSQKRIGTFMNRERIEASASSTFSDLLRSVPGVRMGASTTGIRNSLRFRGSNCAPLVFIDGFPASADEFDVDIIDLASVEGIEIYMGMLTVPAEFNAPRGLEHCGVIAVWSRPYRPSPRPAKTVSPAELQRMVESAAVYTVDDVDTPARIVQDSFSPVYPDSLWKTRTGGQVTVEFVVDSNGLVEMPFFSVVSASHVEFGESVREALARARFAPAMRRGQRVRQLVQLPIRFTRPAA